MQALQSAVGLTAVQNARAVGSSVHVVRNIQRYKATASAQSTTNATQKSLPDFDNVGAAYKFKTSNELRRALLIFRLCGIPPLVQNSRRLIDASYKEEERCARMLIDVQTASRTFTQILGERITNSLMKVTFFGHFCGGENNDDIQPTIKRLSEAGIGSILDYAAEADVGEPLADKEIVLEGGVSADAVTARTYAYAGEAECDQNARISLTAIEGAAVQGPGSFAAVKLTSLGRPELLMHVSAILHETRRLFRAMDEPDLSRKHKGYIERQFNLDTFTRAIGNSGIPMDPNDVESIFKAMDTSGDGNVDYLEWTTYLDPITLSMGKLSNYRHCAELSAEDIQRMKNMVGRLHMLADAASQKGVNLLLDAEQTYMQPAIDHLVLNLQRKYNRGPQPVIFNTFQCYLTDSAERVRIDLERSKREGWKFACKLVRGAYMIQERARALEFGYQDPIHKTIEDTHKNYNDLCELLLQHHGHAHFMVASHNEESVSRVCARMQELGIPRKGGGVAFGQLLGMCDHVSYNLGMDGYDVFKYVPYGPVHEVLPYLIRRAEENSNMLGGAGKEIQLIKGELRRRRTGGR